MMSLMLMVDPEEWMDGGNEMDVIKNDGGEFSSRRCFYWRRGDYVFRGWSFLFCFRN